MPGAVGFVRTHASILGLFPGFGEPIPGRSKVTTDLLERPDGIVTGDDRLILVGAGLLGGCLLYTSPSPRDKRQSRMPSSA